MKKNEILAMCLKNKIKSSNILTFLKSNKERQKLLPRIDQIRKWLMYLEKEEQRKAEKEAKKIKAKKFGLSINEMLRLEDKAYNILRYFSTGYSMGDTKSISINGKLFYEYDNTRSYSGKYAGRETYGNINIDLTKTELRNIERIHGLWTVRKRNDRAKWLLDQGSKQHFEIFFENGYLIGDSHAKTLEEARALETQKQMQKRFKSMGDKVFVGLQHIKKTGACDAGIQAYINRHNLNPEFGYNLGYLKSLENSPFFKTNFLKTKTMKEQNKLIAEFMGWKEQTDPTERWFGQFFDTHGMRKGGNDKEPLLFHSSWDWLMPVVEKIMDICERGQGFICHRFFIGTSSINIKIEHGNRNFFRIDKYFENSNSKLEAIYKAVIEFINWYNQQNQDQ